MTTYEECGPNEATLSPSALRMIRAGWRPTLTVSRVNTWAQYGYGLLVGRVRMRHEFDRLEQELRL